MPRLGRSRPASNYRPQRKLIPGASGPTAWNIDVSQTVTATTSADVLTNHPIDVNQTITATSTANIVKQTNWVIDVAQTVTATTSVDVAKNAAAIVNSRSGMPLVNLAE